MKSDKKDCSRRSFLSKAGAGFAAAGIYGVSGKTLKPFDLKTQGKVITRKLGRTGIEVPIISMGVMNANNPEVIKQSYEEGVRFFDTANGYQRGKNEEMLGSVIKQMGIRDKVIVQTKVEVPRGGRGQGGERQTLTSEQKKEAFLKGFDVSMDRLQMDYVDIFLIHRPSVEAMNDPGLIAALDQIKKEKRTRFIGVSTHQNQAGVLNEAARSGYYDVVLTAINYTMAENRELLDAIKNAAKKNIGIIAMKPLAVNRRNPQPSNYTAALKWVMQNENIHTTIPGYTNFDHLKENWSVSYGLDYTSDEKKFLESKEVKMGMGFCQQCAECVPKCPQNVDIPTLMRVHMYAAGYSNFQHARYTLDEIPEEESLIKCASCSECTVKCVNSVEIAANIDELKLIYS